jgi:hypothetical protein
MQEDGRALLNAFEWHITQELFRCCIYPRARHSSSAPHPFASFWARPHAGWVGQPLKATELLAAHGAAGGWERVLQWPEGSQG